MGCKDSQLNVKSLNLFNLFLVGDLLARIETVLPKGRHQASIRGGFNAVNTAGKNSVLTDINVLILRG